MSQTPFYLLLIELGTALAVGASVSTQVTARRSLLQVSQTKRIGRCTFDHSDLDAVLQKFVRPEVTVDGIRSSLFDYEAILASDDDFKQLDDYVKSLSSFDPSCLSQHGQLAFWVNAYNGVIIHFVLSHAKSNGGQLTKSIRDLKGDKANVWLQEAGTVGGKVLTLGEVETEGTKLGDPRIHAALNCASFSCPDLRGGAYSAENIHSELDVQVKNWLENPTKGAKSDTGGYMVSPIFDWHEADFPSVAAFVAEPLGLTPDAVKIEGYLTYNWNLNAPASTAAELVEKAVRPTKLVHKKTHRVLKEA